MVEQESFREPAKTTRVLEYVPVNLLNPRPPSVSSRLEPESDAKSQQTNLRDKKELFDFLSKNQKNKKITEYEKIKAKKEIEGCTFKPKIYSKVNRDRG